MLKRDKNKEISDQSRVLRTEGTANLVLLACCRQTGRFEPLSKWPDAGQYEGNSMKKRQRYNHFAQKEQVAER